MAAVQNFCDILYREGEVVGMQPISFIILPPDEFFEI